MNRPEQTAVREPEETLALTITPTAEIVSVDGVECRAWRGATLDGKTRCMVFVHRIGAASGPGTEAFDRALQEMARPQSRAADAAMRRAGL